MFSSIVRTGYVIPSRRVSHIITGTSRHRRGIRVNSANYCEIARPRAPRDFGSRSFAMQQVGGGGYIALLCSAESSPRKGRIFWKSECRRDGDSIMREINENGRSRNNFTSRGLRNIASRWFILGERPWFSTRRWEILLNFRNTEPDCLSESQALGS